MHFKYGFGKEFKEFDIEDKNVSAELRLNDFNQSLTGEAEIRRSLQNPIDSKKLSEIVGRGERVVIITSDITRPFPSKTVLPSLLEELALGGTKDEDIKIIFALGSHRNHTETEMKYLVGEDIFNRIKCIDSDPNDCIRLGYTSSGTPVDIFREVTQADRRICLGNIEFHYFAGYSGGAKAIMPGVSSREAIRANHSAMVRLNSKAGEIDLNPVRQDIEEVIHYIPIDFILNVVLDEKKNIIKAFSGHYKFAHREGCEFLDTLYKVTIPERADIVITTPGGYPKDINLYQAQKALDNAKHAVREGGIIILLASCEEGLGEKVFEKWIIEAKTVEGMIIAIEEDFQLGGHKAAAIALVRKKAKIFIVSKLDKQLSEKIFMEPYMDMKDAIKAAFEELGKDSKVILMPFGGSTLPIL
jgi:lactate racemase